MFLIIDIGNTRVKLAVYENDNIVEFVVFDKKELRKKIEKIILNFSIKHAIVSSVALLNDEDKLFLEEKAPTLFLDSETKVPFRNLYGTPKTLGVDRIALASAATKFYPDQNVLVIDAGTCITYDYINKKREYLGGAIAPGIAMRYKALHDYTAKLPELSKEEAVNFIGKDTKSSMHSGVIQGIIHEIDGFINQYKFENENLTVVLTGGDSNFLAKQLKSVIFAQPNFVLDGLFTILTYNLLND